MSDAATADIQPDTTPRKVDSEADIRGMVDNATADRLYGWAFDATRPGERLRVELRLAGQTVVSMLADQLRPDLAQNGVGDGRHAFEMPMQADWLERRTELAVVVIGPDGQEVPVPVRLRLPEPDLRVTVRTLLAEQRRLREAVELMSVHVAELPDAALLQRAVTQQAELGERLGALELWLARLDRRLADVPAAAPARAGMDRWQAALFGILGLACAIALGASLLLRTN